MSKEINTIVVSPRKDFGKGASRRARREGKIPAIVYSKGTENYGCLVEASDWHLLTRHDIGLLTLIEGDKRTAVLIKDVQVDTLKNRIIHIDFIEVKMNEEITTSVQIHSIGEDAVGLSQGGVLEQQAHSVEVKCLPGALPEELEVDISNLGLDSTLTAGELPLPEGVTLISDPDTVIFRIETPAAEVSANAAGDEEGDAAGEGEAE